MDTRDAQLRRAVKKACNGLKRVRSAAVVRFFERHVVELEKQLRVGDQHGFFQNNWKSLYSGRVWYGRRSGAVLQGWWMVAGGHRIDRRKCIEPRCIIVS